MPKQTARMASGPSKLRDGDAGLRKQQRQQQHRRHRQLTQWVKQHVKQALKFQPQTDRWAYDAMDETQQEHWKTKAISGNVVARRIRANAWSPHTAPLRLVLVMFDEHTQWDAATEQVLKAARRVRIIDPSPEFVQNTGHLEQLEIIRGDRIQALPLAFQNLNCLRIAGLRHLKSIAGVHMPRLRTLHLEKLPSLKSVNAEYPGLHTFKVVCCNRLRKLPFLPKIYFYTVCQCRYITEAPAHPNRRCSVVFVPSSPIASDSSPPPA